MIAACLVMLLSQEVYVTGTLVEDHRNILIVDISHAASAYGFTSSEYQHYPIERENCVVRKHK